MSAETAFWGERTVLRQEQCDREQGGSRRRGDQGGDVDGGGSRLFRTCKLIGEMRS